MPASVLIPPDNRLLGWSLSDLTLYGTQPTAGLAIGRARDDDAAIVPNASAPAASPAATSAAPSESDQAASDTLALLDSDGAQPPLPSAAPLSTAALDHDTSATPPPAAVAQPIGSGSFVQAPVVTPLHGAAVDQGNQSAPIAGMHGDAVASTLNTLAATTVDSLSHAADAVLTDHLTALDPAGTIETVVTDLGTAELLPPGAEIASLASAPLDAMPISAFGGSDPAAGLQTLIGMVDSAEAFDIGHTEATGVEATPNSILDALAADEAPSSLLGDHSDVVHHALDDHGIHLGG